MLPLPYWCRTSPASESRIPKPRHTVARGKVRSLEEGSVRSGSSSTEENAGRFRKRAGTGSKKPVEDLERGWVGSGLELPQDTSDLAPELAGAPEARFHARCSCNFALRSSPGQPYQCLLCCTGEALAVAAQLAEPTDDDSTEAAPHQAKEGLEASPIGPTDSTQAAPATDMSGALLPDAVDVATQMTPKSAVQHVQPKQGCRCCSMM